MDFQAQPRIALEVVPASLQLGQTQAQPPEAGITITPTAIAGFIGAATLALSTWLVKAMISQAVARWTDKLDSLKTEQMEIATSSEKAIARLDSDYRLALSKLETAIERQPTQKQIDHLDQRLANFAGSLQELQSLIRATQGEFVDVRREFSKTFVTNDRYIQDVALYNAKVDRLHERIDTMTRLLMEMKGGNFDRNASTGN